jgi:hypothetical protein
MDPLRMRTLTRLLPPPDTVLGTEAGWTQWPIWTIDRARSFWCNASVNTQCQINFKFNVSPAELAEAFAPLAEPIAKVPGLRWKIWSLNEATSEFADRRLGHNFASGWRGICPHYAGASWASAWSRPVGSRSPRIRAKGLCCLPPRPSLVGPSK